MTLVSMVADARLSRLIIPRMPVQESVSNVIGATEASPEQQDWSDVEAVFALAIENAVDVPPVILALGSGRDRRTPWREHRPLRVAKPAVIRAGNYPPCSMRFWRA